MPPAADAVLQSRADAPWLPDGGRADVVRSATPPRPAGLVRLLLRRDGTVFCVPRDGTGRLDLPTRAVPPGDPDGTATAAALARDVLARDVPLTVAGFVRNTVVAPPADYPWPAPVAHFTVVEADGEPVVAGTWVGLRDGVLDDRHWFPLVAPQGP